MLKTKRATVNAVNHQKFPEILRLVLKYGGIISNDGGHELNRA